LEDRLEHIAEPITLSIIGCVVNGPGEARETDVGFTGGGSGSGMVYVAGRPDHKKPHDEMIDHLVTLVENKAHDMAAMAIADEDPAPQDPAPQDSAKGQ
jgi:(E)-4-hydroxy-3-methylbut-2-enyl-diphosphate synthase